MTSVAPLSGTTLALFIALASVTAVAVRFRPIAGVVLLVLFDPFDFSRHLFATNVTTTKAILIGMYVGLALRRAPFARILNARAVKLTLLGAAGLALATLATVIPAEYLPAALRESSKALEYAAIFVAAAVAFAEDRDERLVWWALAATVSLTSAIAFVQAHGAGSSVVVILGKVVPRLSGPLEGPNQLAGFYDIAAPLLFARLVRERSPIAGIACAASVASDVLTLSRAGLLALVVGCATVLGRLARGRREVLLAGAALAGVLALVALLGHDLLSARFAPGSEVDLGTGLGTRHQLWRAAIQLFLEHPLLGVGADNYETSLPSLGLTGIRTHANNLYLQSLAEGGVVLFAATIASFAFSLLALRPASKQSALVAGVLSGTIALAVHQSLDDLTFFPKVGGFWWLWLGIAAGSLVESDAASTIRIFTRRNAAITLAATAVLIATLPFTLREPKQFHDPTAPPTLAIANGVALPFGVDAEPVLREQTGLYPAEVTIDTLCCWLAPDATIHVRPPADATSLTLTLFVPAFDFFNHGGQRTHVRLGNAERIVDFPSPNQESVTLPVDPLEAGSRGSIDLRIHSERTFVPSAEGVNADPRALAVVLRSVSFR